MNLNPIDVFFMLALGAILWLLVIRPQSQERAAHEALLKTLSKDDRVITSSGVHGRVVEVGAETVVLEVAEKARITFDKTAVARRQGEPKPA